MKSLTNKQKQQLVEIITEQSGNGMTRANFTDALLQLLEDVPGFETAKQSVIANLTNNLWSQYRE